MKLLKNLSVRTMLILTFVLVSAGFIVGVAVGDRVSAHMHQEAVGIYENALIPTSAVGDIMRNIHDSRAQLLLSLQHDPSGEWAKMHDHAIDKHLNAFADAIDDAQAAHASYAKRSELPDVERQLLGEIGTALEAFAAAGNEVVAAFRAGEFHQANVLILTKINPGMGALEKKVRELEMVLIKRSKEENETAGEMRVRLSILMWAGTGGGVALVWAMYFILARGITRPLARVRDAVSRVAEGDLTTPIAAPGRNEFDAVLRSVAAMQGSLREMATEIRRAADSVSQDAQQLSQRIDDSARHSETQRQQIGAVTSALQQMSRSIEEVSGGVHGVDDATRRARDLAEDGAQRMEGNLQTVNKIVETVRDSSGAITELCDTARQVHELAGIIKDIAGQTNLLALNAAIEAARAGEQGRGFAVVADEVRKLAERTAQSSINIGELLDSVGQRSDQAIKAMQQVMADVEQGAAQTREIGETLRRIRDAANETSQLTREIAGATVQQTQASTQTVDSMHDISSLTDHNNAAIQEVAVTASEMAAISGRLLSLVGRFRIAA